MAEHDHGRALAQLMEDLHRSVERFRAAMLRNQQTRFWAEHRQCDASEQAFLDAQHAHEERLATTICEAMQDVLAQAVPPMAQTIMERVPGWARDQRAQTLQRGEEKSLTPTRAVEEEALAQEQPAPRPSWREGWRARHGITVPSRSAGQRRGTQQTVTEEQTHGQRYGGRRGD